jgi:hypothetical protein
MSTDRLLDRLDQHIAYETMCGRSHTTRVLQDSAPHGHMVAILIDDNLVVRAEGRRRHEAVDAAILAFAEYVESVDQEVRRAG